MNTQSGLPSIRPIQTSPLTLSDHLITLAETADHAGYIHTARRLVSLACAVLDEAPTLPH